MRSSGIERIPCRYKRSAKPRWFGQAEDVNDRGDGRALDYDAPPNLGTSYQPLGFRPINRPRKRRQSESPYRTLRGPVMLGQRGVVYCDGRSRLLVDDDETPQAETSADASLGCQHGE